MARGWATDLPLSKSVPDAAQAVGLSRITLAVRPESFTVAATRVTGLPLEVVLVGTRRAASTPRPASVPGEPRTSQTRLKSMPVQSHDFVIGFDPHSAIA